MELYVTRHGQTRYNVENRVCGISDVELTALGKRQAQDLANQLKDLHFDLIIVSPLIRARQTAKIINETLQTEMIIDERLHEIDFGIYEGVESQTSGFQQVKANHGCHYPQGESYFEVIHRVYSLLDDIQKNMQDKRVLLVCHGGIVRTIYTYFHDITNDDLYHFLPDNCCLNHYQL